MADMKTTRIRLVGVSHNQCNHPNCDATLVEIDVKSNRAVITGQAAHIKGDKPGAARYDKLMTDDERSDFDNLIMLCPRHHKLIDDKESRDSYSVELIKKWKGDHLEKFSKVEDRNWIYLGGTLSYVEDGYVEDDYAVKIHYWVDKNGKAQIYTPERLVVAQSLKRMGRLFSEIQSAFSCLDTATGQPSNPSHITQNDSYVRIMKDEYERIKEGNPNFVSHLHTLQMLCKDITIGELMIASTHNGYKMRENMYLQADEAIQEAAKAIKPIIVEPRGS